MENNADPFIIDLVGQEERITSYEVRKLGNEYRDRLKLTEKEVDILNRLWYPDNNFNNIEFCRQETTKLFLFLLEGLERRCAKENTVPEIHINTIADIHACKTLGNGINDYNYKYAVLTTIGEIYSYIFKYAENAIREIYGHKRRLSVDPHYNDEEVLEALESKIISKVKLILPVWIPKVIAPDEETDIELYARNTNRWKARFQEICDHNVSNSEQFLADILALGRLNERNPSVEMIFFEASKFIAKRDRTIGLILYIHYIYEDLKSPAFDNRKLNKTVQKSLFSTEEQVRDFEEIINALISNQDLKQAKAAVSKIFQPKRKKIQLDERAIQEINKKHTNTVELLNEYLQDEEFENQGDKDDKEQEVELKIPEDIIVVPSTLFIDTLAFTPLQLDTLQLFSKYNFTVSQSEFINYAKSKAAFKNQLIDSINETCYEHLDDILIEEEEENYIIQDYNYQMILIK